MEPSEIPLMILSVIFQPGLLVLMLVLIVTSALFSMTEMAYSAVGKVRLKTLIEQNVKGSKKAYWIVENFDRTLTTLLVGNNLANVALTTVSVLFFSGLLRSLPNSDTLITIINTVVITIIVLIFGEILPKSLAKTHPERVSLFFSGLIYFLIKILTPITYPFRVLNRRVIRQDGEGRPTVTESELETIIDTMEEEGSIDEEEADMLQKVLDLSEITVEEIMTPRVDMIAIDIQASVNQIRDIFFKSKFSRIPVYDGNSDNIIGILSERDFYTKLIKGQNINIKKLLRKAIFVPSTSKVDALIELLQMENSHIAIVIDEYGGVDGLVTMEDALEELVGEIYDEHDDVTEAILQKDENHYLINAEIDLKVLFEDLNLGETPLSDSTSLGGWLFEKFQDIPDVGEKYQYELSVNQVYDELSELVSEDKEILTFTILKVKKRRIKSVLLKVELQSYQPFVRED
ncbi:MAG: hemolysin family protein [Candidatus Izemoplasmatales bacterium]|nr:hemolysin family protein [Candidatus Izemoplasmatales bacterium]